MSQRRSLVCAFVAVALCLAMALAGSMHLSAAFADEGAPAGDSAPSTESANPEVTGTGDSQAPAEGGDPSLNNESAAPQGGESDAPAGNNGNAGAPSEGTGSEGESVPAGDAVTSGEGAPSDGTSTDSASNADGTVNGPASSAAADSDAGVAPVAAGDESVIVDGSTLTAWESHLSSDGASTQNIGRIWTDKTVAAGDVELSGGASMTVSKGDSDFVVGLSALSSMSSITNETPKPLDIVLVLDTSSSMLGEMDGAPEYTRVDPSDVTIENGYYWVQHNGAYRRVQQYPGQNYWYYQEGNNYYYFEPTEQHPGNDYFNVVDFYSISNSRLAALKEAVDGFIDSTDAANQEMPDGQKHEIALITYGEDATVRNGFTEDALALKGVVDGLPANHTTRSDLGMQEAQNLLRDSGRDDARKIVIFFTDGKPAKGGDGSFNAEVANEAITIGSDLNSEGTLVYTVGVFEGADVNETVVDPNDETTWFNAYMNGLSSKYPYAESYTDLGDRVGTREYYKVASDEAGLAQVFQEIASELKTEMSESPLSSGGAGGERGYLTFTDELGKYMEVDSVKSIVFANQQFTQSSSTTDDSTHATTYVFDQEVTDSTGIFPNGNLNQIIIKVQKYPDDLAKGDTVTVEIPANLIPLRNYQASVDKEGNVAWQGVTAAYPVRVFYGVSLKADVANAIKSGTTGNAETDAALKEYIATNTSEVNGHKSVNFLSNLFEGTPGEGSGTTKATFTPAASNGYYYVQEDTPLYIYVGDELVELTRANYEQYNPENVYYKQTVYKEGAAQAVDEIVAIPVAKFAEGVEEGMVAGGETDGAYLVKGSPRLSRITEFEDAKGELPGSNNDTNTAALAVNPNWDTRAAGSGITVQLGNNGKLSVELPGELRVSKEVTVADGLDKEQFSNTEFSFTVNVAGMANQEVWAQVVNTNGGAVVVDKTEITLDDQGNYTTKLKDGQTLVLTGLNDGATYTVMEDLSQNKGFTQSSGGATGTISSGTVAEAKFTNHYAVTQATANDINAQKKFTDADTGADMAWDGVTFDFVIEASAGGTDDEGNKTGSYDGKGNAITNVADIPMPEGAINGVKHQTVTSVDAFDFGSINYTKPGTYVYHVWERTPDVHASDWLAGVAYSAAVYHVQIVVKDNGQGALYIDEDASTMYMEIEDDGDELTAQDKVDAAVITNTYKRDTAQAQFRATKIWNDTTGSRALADSQFGFVLEATGGTAKDGSAIDVADVPMLTSNATVPNSGTSVSWGNIEFTNAMEGNTYTYKLYEYQPTVDGKYESAGRDDTAKQNDNGEWVWRGTTYDKTVYTAEVQVSVDIENEGQPNESQHVHAAITYKDAEGNVVYEEDGTTPVDRVPFTNSYAVTSIDGSALQVQKTLDGRAMKDGEKFTFTQTLIAGDSTGVSGLNSEATVTGDGEKTVDTSNFGVPTFTKPDTYTFQIEEQGTNGNGLTYDTHKATVTYVVNDTHPTDENIAHTGNLRVESVTYNNTAALTAADRAETGVAAFTNTYRTTKTFDGITVSKTLNGRAMVSGEFDFTITPQNQNANDRKVASTDAKFSNTSNSTSGVTENMTGKLASLTFTQADSGKDFTYLIDETEGTTPGVTYDTKRYHLTIHVSDNGEGSLTATPTIKLADADGNPTGDEVPAAFVNEYAPADSNAVTPQLNKILTGCDWTNGETFTFNFEKVSAFVSGMSVDDALKIAPLPMKDGVETTSITLKGSEGLAGTKSGVAVPVDFGSLTFTKAGTYVYKATEVIPDDATNEATKDADGKLIPYAQASDEQKEQAGWKKDGITYTVRPTLISVTVTDNTTDGRLEASVTMDNGGNFRNSYAASQNFDDAVSFQLTKTLNGHHMAANQFQFNVTALDGVNANAAETAMKFGLSADGQTTFVQAPGAEGDDGEKVVMPAGDRKVTFTQADSGKTFKLQFDEVQKSATEAPGYTYDNAKYVMEVTPTDLGNGAMSIVTKVTKTWIDADGASQSETKEYSWKSGDEKAAVSLDFVNAYTAEGYATISGTKNIEGSWSGNKSDFRFSIKQVADEKGAELADDDRIARAELPGDGTTVSNADGAFSFVNIKFNKPGEYYFKVWESAGLTGSGWTNSKDEKIVKVTVEEEDKEGYGSGKLTVTVDAEDLAALTFTNKYTQTASDAKSIEITKTVAGHDATAGQFKFELIADDAAKAAIKSGDITGVTVDDNGLVATESNKAAIANGKSETISFAGMTFHKVTKDDGYTFTVKEVVKADEDEKLDGVQNSGWTMDTHEYKVNIKVTDVDSKLTANVTTVGDGGSAFSNIFGAATTLGANGGLRVTKKLEGRTLEADQFEFTIEAMADADNADAAAAKLSKLEGVKDGVLSFKNVASGNDNTAVMDELGELAFDEKDINKTFTYTVSELVDSKMDAAGYDYDENLTATVAITVKEGDNGTIYTETVVTKGETSVTYNGSQNETASVPFTNSYSATGTLDGSANLAGTKALQDSRGNNVPLNGRQWSFTLEGADDATKAAIEAGTVVPPAENPVQNNSDGAFNFGDITFKSTGAASVDYTFTVTESGSVDGVDNDATPTRAITVRVTDNGDGTLTAAVVEGSSDNLNFVNTYGAKSDTQIAIKGTKTLDANGFGNVPNIKEQFTFELAAETGSPFTPGEDFANNVKNPNENGTGEVSFGNLTFSMADLAGTEYGEDGTRSKTFTYIVTEAGDVPGVTNDTTNPRTLSIKLTDNGKGTLTAMLEDATDGNAFVFTNTYAPGVVTNVPAKVTKVLAGDRGVALQANEFTFVMSVVAQEDSPSDGFTMPGDATAKNAADGSVTFNNITFTKEGTYTVTVKEQVPTDADKAPYMTYDEHSFTYDVVVSADGAGDLKAKVQNASTADGGSTFTNTYTTPEQKKDAYLGDYSDTKTNINGQMVGVGDEITYVINWANDAIDESGKSVTADITVTDNVPAGTEFVGASNGGTEQPDGSIKWELGNQPAGKTGTVTMTVRVTDAAVTVEEITNKATINIGGHNAETNPVTNTTPKKTLDGKPQIEGDIQVGSELTYTITWANTTGEKANVTITDVLPEGLTFVEASNGGALGEKNTVTWNLGVQEPSASGSVTVKVKVNANAVKPDADNSNKATLQIGDKPDINTNTVPGPEITSGPLTISKKVVGEVTTPTAFSFNLTATAADGTKLSGEYAYTGRGVEDGTLTFVEGKASIELADGKAITFTALPKGTTVTATEKLVAGFTASTNPLTGKVDGTDDVSLDFVNTYIGDNNNTKDVFGAENPTTSVNGKLVGVDDTLAYTINWMNDAVDENGVAAKATVVVTDKVPAGTEYVEGSATEGGVYDVATRTITWTLTDRKPLAKGTLSFKVTVSEDAVNVDKITNKAEVKVGKNDPKPTTETENYVPQKEEITEPSEIKPGDTLTYRISFTNTDGAGATATVVDNLSEGLKYVAGSAKSLIIDQNGAGVMGAPEPAVSGQTLTWGLANLPEGASVQITFDVRVTRDALSSVDNRAIVNGHDSNVVTTPVPTDNAKHVKDDEGATIDGKLVSPGDVLHYSIDWANEGNNESGNVTIIDTLPAGVTVDAGSISEGGTLSADGKTITWNLTNKQAGERGTVTFSVTVNDAAAEPGDVADLVNTATVNGHTVSVENYVPGKDGKSSVDGSGDEAKGDVYVGQELTYTIAYRNTESEATTVTITDKVPEHTEFVSATDDITPAEDGTLTWTKENVASGAEGTVSFTVRVNEDALSVDKVNNTATVKIGDRETTTNTTTNQVSKGSLVISKTVNAGDTGTEIDKGQEFSFTITLTDANDKALTGKYAYTKTGEGLPEAGEAGELNFEGSNVEGAEITAGSAVIALKHGQSITIEDLPADAKYTVTEAPVAGYMQTEPASDESGKATPATGAIPAGKTAQADFENTFKPDAVTNAPVGVTKKLEGNRTPGLQAGEFTFVMNVEALEGSPEDGFQLPEDATGTNDADGKVTFSNITFTKVGTYKVTVTEQAGSDPLISYDGHEYTYEVKVEKIDNALKATVVENTEAGSKEFTNTFNGGGDSKDVVSPSDPETSINGQLVGVGDQLTYKITWKNDAVDSTGKAAKADVTVTDKVPAGTTFVSATDDIKPAEDGILTWTIKDAAPGASGTVSFTVEVNNDAVSNDPITNEASIKVGDNDPKTTNKVENDFPSKTVNDGKPAVEGDIQVGDELVYTIEWANTIGEPATVTVTDKLPEGLTFLEASDGGALSEDEDQPNTVIWNLGEKQSGDKGSVTVRVLVNEKALTSAIDNKATLNIGNNPVINTNTVPGGTPEAADGNLVIGKQVTFEAGQVNEGQAKDKPFSFNVSVVDVNGNPVTGEFGYTGQGGAEDGRLTLDEDGTGTVTLKDGQSIEIAGLPSGATWTVTETPGLPGYTALVPTDKSEDMVEGNTITGTIGFGQGIATAFFENHYAVEPTDLEGATNLEVTKNLEGRDWAEGDSFTFVLSANMEDEATKAAVKAGNIALPENASGITINNATPDHQAAFGNITFKQAGDFQFYITEQQGDLGGVSYDTADKLVKVHVDDNGDGTLTATAIDGASPVITNAYSSTGTLDTTAAGLFTKSFMGKAWEDERFGFEIEAQGDAPQPENTEAEVTADSATVPEPEDGMSDMGVGPDTANATRTFGFGDISFTGENMFDENGARVFEKTFTYKVWENHPADATESTDPAGFWEANGIMYDGHEATLTVTVTDDGKGNLTATPSVEQGNFSNLAEATTVNEATLSLFGTKLLKGETGNDVALGDRTWNFSLGGADDVTKTAIENGLVILPAEVTNNADGSIDFGAITFKSAGIAATVEYQFKVMETGDVPDTELDTKEHIIKVVVTDDGQGNLTATLAEDSEQPVVITNTYTKDNKINLGLDVSKVLNGRAQEAGEFDFELAAKPSGEGAAEPEFVMTGATSADAADGAESAVTFEPERLELGFTDLQQAVKDGYATYDEATKTWQLHYTVRELTDNLPAGVTAQGNTSYDVTFQVTDNGDGTLAETGAPARYVFTNTYAASGSTAIEATKTLNGRAAKSGEFTFDIALQPVEGSAATTEQIVSTGVNIAAAADEKALVEFDTRGALTYDLGSLNQAVADGYAVAGTNGAGRRVWTLNYQIRENTSALPGGVWAGENSVQSFTVTVTDNGDGTLSTDVAVLGTDAEGNPIYGPYVDPFEFVNDYRPTGGDFTGFVAAKYITGRNFTAADSFNFSVSVADDSAEGTPLPANVASVDGETGDVTFVPTEGADSGTIDFGSIHFTKGGTYKYIVTELGVDGTPASGGTNNGLTYDATMYEVTIQVDDLLTGTLVVNEPVYTLLNTDGSPVLDESGSPVSVDAITFTNAYATGGTEVDTNPTDTSALFTKTFSGKAWGDESFGFTIAPQNGAPAPESLTATVGRDSALAPADGSDVDPSMGAGAANDVRVFGFGKVRFADADMADAEVQPDGSRAKTFTYLVSENIPEDVKPDRVDGKLVGADGIVYDGHTATLSITVRDDGRGNLTAIPDEEHPNLGASASEGNFSNLFETGEADYAAYANVQIVKTLTGRDMAEGETFSFMVTPTDLASADRLSLSTEGTTVTTPAAVEGASATTALFPVANEVVFTQEDVGKTYGFTVSEVNDGKGGVTYDATTYAIEISVSQNEEGALVVATTAVPTRDGEQGEPFSTTYTQGAEPVAPLALTFTNTYATGGTTLDTNANVLFTKSFAGKAWDSERFSFEIEAQGDAPAPENTQTEVAPESPAAPAGDAGIDEGMGADNANATKSFGFGTITFFDANMRNENGERVFEKEFTYKVWENHPADAVAAEDLGTDEQGNPLAWDASDGITYDGHTATLVVTVVDDGQGNLTISNVSVSEGNFSNLATAEPVTTGGVLVQKTLTGRDMEQDQFSFTLAADDALSADRLGIPTADAGGTGFSMKAAADSTPAQVDVTTELEALANRFRFTREDAGNTYGFTVAENLPEGVTAENNYTLDGYTYDVTRYGVSFTVSVDEQGAMTVRALATNLTTGVTVLDQTVAEGQALPMIVLPYTNTYKAGAIITDDVEGAAKLEATKTLAGRPQLDGEFSFEVVDEAGNVVATASSTQAGEGEPGALTFSDIEYTLTHGELEGLGDVTYVTDGHTNAPANSNGEYTFVYTLTELTAAGSLPSGVTPDDPSSFTVVVMLTDNGDGTLAAQVSYPDIDGIPAFHNTYAGDVVAQAAINGSKAVKGLPEGTYLESGDFSFTMTPLTGGDSNAEATVAVKVPAGSTANEGTFSFPLTYTTDDLRDVEPVLGEDGVTQTRTKVFTYAISEVNSRQFGVHYDDALYFVDVTLTDHGDGSLTATVSNVWPENGEPIDPTTGIVFTNVYDESAIQWTPQGLKATHAEEGVGLAGKTFGFVVTDAMGNRVSSGVSGANGDITFAPITLPGEGTHYYTIYELRSGAQGGITYDATTYTLELTVEPDGNGTYSFTAVYTNDVTGEVVDKAYFTNEYASVGTSIDLSATKTITAPHTAAGFRFAVVDDATGEQVATGASDANGAVAFNTIYYSYGETTVALPSVAGLTGEAATAALASANLAASVVEGDAAPSAEQAGLVYKAIANGVEVVAGTPVPTSATVDLYVYGPYVEQAVTPDPMTPSDDVATGDDAANTEPGTEPGTDADAEPVTPVEPNAGATGTEPSLPIEPDAPVTDEAADAVEPTEPVAEPSSELPAEPAVAAAVDLFAPSIAIADDQNVAPYVGEAPAALAISSTDLGDHWYTIYEINDGQDGVTYDEAYYRVRVTVVDNGNGTMSAAVTKVERIDVDGIITDVTLEGANGMANVVFTNEYKANHPATATLEGTKTLTGRDANAGEFTFTVTDAATGEVVAGGQSEAAASGQAAPIAFGTLHFSKAGEYDYVVSEAKGGQTIAGVTYDASTFAVHVSVVDNGDGTLTATVSYPDGPVAFENDYKVTQGTEATLEGTKTLTGRDANAGEFGFVVTDGSGAMVGTGQSAAAPEGQPAKIVFSRLHFSEPGEYLYTVSEVGAGQTLAGITFDTTQLRVKVVVTDNLDGTLSAQVEYLDGPIAFRNVYGATGGEGSTVVPQATKTLTGRELRAGEFTFALKDMATGEVVSTATNAADGTVTFPALRYEQAGEHEYTVFEVAGREEGMTYDASTYRLQVGVTDDGKGHLVATATYPDGTPSFQNSYEKPEKPEEPEPPTPENPDTPDNPGTPGEPGEPDIPKTGDPTGPLALVSAVMGTLVLGGAGVLVRRKLRIQK